MCSFCVWQGLPIPKQEHSVPQIAFKILNAFGHGLQKKMVHIFPFGIDTVLVSVTAPTDSLSKRYIFNDVAAQLKILKIA